MLEELRTFANYKVNLTRFYQLWVCCGDIINLCIHALITNTSTWKMKNTKLTHTKYK